eukprot:798102-Amphidinium_carterae.1
MFGAACFKGNSGLATQGLLCTAAHSNAKCLPFSFSNIFANPACEMVAFACLKWARLGGSRNGRSTGCRIKGLGCSSHSSAELCI